MQAIKEAYLSDILQVAYVLSAALYFFRMSRKIAHIHHDDLSVCL